jgi:hypothetical protein
MGDDVTIETHCLIPGPPVYREKKNSFSRKNTDRHYRHFFSPKNLHRALFFRPLWRVTMTA